MRLSDNSIWVATRVEFGTFTYIIDVTMTDIDLLALESENRTGACSGNMRATITDGATINYEYRNTSGALVGRFEIASCP